MGALVNIYIMVTSLGALLRHLGNVIRYVDLTNLI